MTKESALKEFFGGFGIPAYTSTSVVNENGEEDVTFPYLTYDVITDVWDGGEVGLTVNLWYRTESEAIPNAKARELSEAIGMGGKIIHCDGGYIRLKRGSPWCQSLRDDTDQIIKRRYINITARYYTEN